MTDDRLPAQRRIDLARIGGPAPVHKAGELLFAGTTGSREELWPKFSDAVRDRVRDRAGEQVEWWAAEYDGRLSAVVFGTKALISLDPTVNDAGGHATRITTMPVEERSFRSARVTGAPASGTVTPPAPGPSGKGPRQLAEDLAGFLGQLPARAQQLLQDPFQANDDPLQYDYYFYRTTGSDKVGGGLLYVWIYLTDKRSLTFCAGVGHGYQPSRGVSTWDLTCWRADVPQGAAG